MRFGSEVVCSVTVLLGESTLHARDRLFVYFSVMVDGGGGDGERPLISITPPSSLSFLLVVVHPFVHSCSPQPSAAVKIKDSSFSFHKENTGHSLAKIMLALQASGRSLFYLHVNCALGLFCANESKLVKRIAVV